ncbi:MAG: tagaturonate epimerase family protein [Bryobacteraceae bacterium]
MLSLAKYSVGVGDRFARQAEAQLAACMLAAESGVEVVPVWNKSYREHAIIGSRPADTRAAADAAVRKLGWRKPYHVDADHINLKTVDGFLDACDFFTLDVAERIGRPDGVREAISEAGRIYRRILEGRQRRPFITEISMDETDRPQTPEELLTILAAIAEEGIPVQTIAPRFTGRFNKGVDYVGDTVRFAEEFAAGIETIAQAVRMYGLPSSLKLSVHSGSDKFSLYGPMREALRRYDAGIHLKTAGTTWLEELIGLAEAGGAGLVLVKDVYVAAYARREELCAPYAAVIDIDPARLPEPASVRGWTSEQVVAALRHDPACPEFNPDLRQLLHVGYKVAAEMGRRYLDLLAACKETVTRNVTANLFERHIKPLLL